MRVFRLLRHNGALKKNIKKTETSTERENGVNFNIKVKMIASK